MREADSGSILVVDDQEVGRYTKARILRAAGYDVLEAATGEDALRLVAERLPRLVVLDVNLPDMTGWDVCKRLKENPETASIAVLQVSATHVRDEDTVRSLEGGADAALLEPLDASVFVATVRALLRARQAEEALRDALARETAARALAETANRMKDDFLATLSHELRSPLGSILTWVTLLRSGHVDDEKRSRAFEAIERNTRLQAKLVEELLDVSRIVSGKMRLELAPVDLARVVDGALDGARASAEAKGVRLEAVIDPKIGPITGDAGRLQQVVANLLSNAVKFTPRGGRIEVRLDRPDQRIRLRVTDTGRGIDPAFLPHIYERFRQADSSSTRAEGGLGLGLALVRHLVELHGGTVDAESPGVGKGATFTVRIPAPAIRSAVAVTGAPRRGVHAASAPPLALQGKRVLVLDDEPDAREAIAAALEAFGAIVTPVPTVSEALEALARSKIDAVVSDIAMPGRSGYTFIEEVRRLPADRGGKQPALALTAHAGAEEQSRILAAGFDAHLAKPIDANELAAAVARLLDGAA